MMPALQRCASHTESKCYSHATATFLYFPNCVPKTHCKEHAAGEDEQGCDKNLS